MPGSYHRTEELFPYRSLRQILARRDPVVHAVAPQDPVARAVQLMSEHNIGLVVVLEAGRLVGVLSERDLVREAGRAEAGALRDRPVADFMTRDVATVAPDDQFGRCMTLMEERGARHVPVVDAERVIGVVSVRDLLREAVAHPREVLAEMERERLTAFQSSARLTGPHALGIEAIACPLAPAQNGWGCKTESRRHAVIEKAQIELAKTLWDQARAAALQAHDAWDMVMNAQKTVMDSMRSAGPPFALAADQYDKLMDFHSKQYKAALDYMNKISTDYQQLLTKSKK